MHLVAAELTHGHSAEDKTAVAQPADAAEVERVLAAPSALECLQLEPGFTRIALKQKYREMVIAVHPDKCKVIMLGSPEL